MGSSTADVTATIRAIADFHGTRPSAEKIGQLAVQAECASDPIMIDDRVVLFAHREGRVLESMGRALPRMIVVGCITDPVAGGIDTVALPPAAYSADDVEAFCFLRAETQAAVSAGDVARLGRVATASALISQRFLAKPALEFLLDVCKRCTGCGVQVAHSGTVAGVIFDPERPGVAADVERCAAYFTQAGLALTGLICPDARSARSGGLGGRYKSARPLQSGQIDVGNAADRVIVKSQGTFDVDRAAALVEVSGTEVAGTAVHADGQVSAPSRVSELNA
jgi:hypothetical protein